MEPISVIRDQDIRAALGEGRQYLAGALSEPQALRHLHDDELEVGISAYPVDTLDAPHRHERAREYQFVIAGRIDILELDSGTEHRLGAGDFYVIERGTAYAQRAAAGTKVLFWKNPGGNDKVPVELTSEQRAWQHLPRAAWGASR
ncbi:MAG: cupin domain-containing protein [Actinomycetales bacterium]|nr:cupin domain-containing protein [Actinomycetales bacterium]